MTRQIGIALGGLACLVAILGTAPPGPPWQITAFPTTPGLSLMGCSLLAGLLLSRGSAAE